jgi:hypothetical protein
MKIRQGFVSNSSSSSFVVITTKEDWDAAVAKLEPLGKLMVEHCIHKPRKVKFLGRDLIAASQEISTEDFGWNIPDKNDQDDGSEIMEQYDKFCELLRKSPNTLMLD